MICGGVASAATRSEEHTSELQSQFHLVCRLLLEKKNLVVSLASGSCLNNSFPVPFASANPPLAACVLPCLIRLVCCSLNSSCASLSCLFTVNSLFTSTTGENCVTTFKALPVASATLFIFLRVSLIPIKASL